MKHSRSNVEGVDGARERGENKDGIEGVRSGRHAGLDDGDDENGTGADGLTPAIDERVIRRDQERYVEDAESIEGDDADVDFPRGHLHALGIREGSTLSSCGGHNIHSHEREKDVDECCPERSVCVLLSVRLFPCDLPDTEECTDISGNDALYVGILVADLISQVEEPVRRVPVWGWKDSIRPGFVCDCDCPGDHNLLLVPTGSSWYAPSRAIRVR